MQLDDTRAATEHVNHEKAVVEKNLKAQEAQHQVLQKKIEENVAVLGDYESQNKRMAAENATLFTRLEELLGNASMLQKVKSQLQSQLDDAKRYLYKFYKGVKSCRLSLNDSYLQNI